MSQYSKLTNNNHFDDDSDIDLSLGADDFVSQQQQQQPQQQSYNNNNNNNKQQPYYNSTKDPKSKSNNNSPGSTKCSSNNCNSTHCEGTETSNNINNNVQSDQIIVSPIDDKRRSYPYSIVWGPLPLISWCIPCIGHLGVADSSGVIHDFHGPYHVQRGRFMVGPVLRYYQLSENVLDKANIKTPQQWDNAINKSDRYYAGTVHNIVSNNCHHHVATAMTNVGIDLTMFQAFWLIMTQGKWVSGQRCVCGVFLPFVILWTLLIGGILLITALARWTGK